MKELKAFLYIVKKWIIDWSNRVEEEARKDRYKSELKRFIDEL